MPNTCIGTSVGSADPLVAIGVLPATGVDARHMPWDQRLDIAKEAIEGTRPITNLAEEHGVSRKFVYQEQRRAETALEEAFSPKAKPADEVLFYLPVTKAWLKQLVLALILICHSSIRGVVELLRDLFDTPFSEGSVLNVLLAAVVSAREVNSREDLSRVRIGAHDEIFQNRRPVLAGVDVRSTYCYLLSLEEHRDAETWGVRLLDLEKQGLHPEATIADAGSGLRAGQALAWPETPCRGDVFHAQMELGEAVTYLRNRALGAISAREHLDQKMARAKQSRRGRNLSFKLAAARKEEARAVRLADDVATLADWLSNDVLALGGPDYDTRRHLFDFIVEELQGREALCPHRIGPVRRMLQNQRDHLLAFAVALDEEIAQVSLDFQVAPDLARAVLALHTLEADSQERWEREAKLRQKLGGRFYAVFEAAEEIARETVRASSVIENLNSRLRCYFFLRRHLGPEYLDLLRFFLNHRRFLRSRHPERVGRSPAEILADGTHPHWLELLGFEILSRN